MNTLKALIATALWMVVPLAMISFWRWDASILLDPLSWLGDMRDKGRLLILAFYLLIFVASCGYYEVDAKEQKRKEERKHEPSQ